MHFLHEFHRQELHAKDRDLEVLGRQHERLRGERDRAERMAGMAGRSPGEEKVGTEVAVEVEGGGAGGGGERQRKKEKEEEVWRLMGAGVGTGETTQDLDRRCAALDKRSAFLDRRSSRVDAREEAVDARSG